MKTVLKTFALVIGLVFGQQALATAQSVDEIIKNYVDIIGGEANWAALKSISSQGKIKQAGMEFDVISIVVRPNKFKTSINLQGREIPLQVSDGNIVWGSNMMTGKVEKMEAEDAQILKQEMELESPFINYKAKGYKVSLEGSEMIEGVDCHKVKLIKKPLIIDGVEVENDSYHFFDKDSGVLIASRSEGKKGQAKGMMTTTLMSDYAEVEGAGIYMPMSTTIQNAGGNVAVELTVVIPNIDIADEIFAYTGE
jgi:hypothetical protein